MSVIYLLMELNGSRIRSLKSGWLLWLSTSHYHISIHSLYFNFQIQLESILNPGREVYHVWSIHM